MNIFFVFKAITEHFQIPPPQHFTVIFMWRHLRKNGTSSMAKANGLATVQSKKLP